MTSRAATSIAVAVSSPVQVVRIVSMVNALAPKTKPIVMAPVSTQPPIERIVGNAKPNARLESFAGMDHA